MNMISFLKSIGYSIEFVNQSALLKKRNTTYSFTHKSKTAKILDSNKKLSTRSINYFPIINSKNKTIWFPLQQILNDLGYDYLYSNKISDKNRKWKKMELENPLFQNFQINLHYF